MQQIGNATRQLIAEHPNLTRQLEDGLLIVLAGKAMPHKEIGKGDYLVKQYTVQLGGTPNRWLCNCVRGNREGYAHIEMLYGSPGKICKHMAAVAICWKALLWPAQPGNLLGFVERVVLTGAMLQGGPIRDTPYPGVKLVRASRIANGHEYVALALKKGREQSGDLACNQGGRWQMAYEASDRYETWAYQFRKENNNDNH
jgi:hypothetical protein